MVSGSTKTMRRIMGITPIEHLGVFFNPASSNYRNQDPCGLPWAADNGGYRGVNVLAFERMLNTLHLRQLPRCLFVVAPDVLANANATTASFFQWLPMLKRYGWPIAYVAQDGLMVLTTPWRYFDVLFIGGTTRFKLGVEAYTLCGYAKALGKGVHIGRVNSPTRLEMFSDVADSVDGTATSMYGDVYIPIMLEAAARKPASRHLQRELL